MLYKLLQAIVVNGGENIESQRKRVRTGKVRKGERRIFYSRGRQVFSYNRLNTKIYPCFSCFHKLGLSNHKTFLYFYVCSLRFRILYVNDIQRKVEEVVLWH